MEKTSVYAYIRFTGKDDIDDFPVEEVTNRLGVQPTTIKRIGERVNDVHTRSFTSWKYESETLETLDVDDVLLPILTVFQDKTDLINRVKEEFNLNVQIELVITMIDGDRSSLLNSVSLRLLSMPLLMSICMYILLMNLKNNHVIAQVFTSVLLQTPTERWSIDVSWVSFCLCAIHATAWLERLFVKKMRLYKKS